MISLNVQSQNSLSDSIVTQWKGASDAFNSLVEKFLFGFFCTCWLAYQSTNLFEQNVLTNKFFWTSVFLSGCLSKFNLLRNSLRTLLPVLVIHSKSPAHKFPNFIMHQIPYIASRSFVSLHINDSLLMSDRFYLPFISDFFDAQYAVQTIGMLH